MGRRWGRVSVRPRHPSTGHLSTGHLAAGHLHGAPEHGAARHGAPRRVTALAVAALAAAAMTGCSALVRLGVEQRPRIHHPLQRPAPADHPETGRRVRAADRDQGQRAQRRRGRAGRPDRDRGQELPGRRLLHRELPAAGVPAGQGLAVGGAQQHAGGDPVEVQLPAGRLGRRVRPGQRAHLQPQPDQQEPAAHLGDAARRPEVPGQARPGRGRDRLPADRHLGPARARRRRHPEVAQRP